MDVSVIIVNYHTEQLIKDAISTIIEHTEGVEYEIIVVDNAPTDGACDFFECLGPKGMVRYVGMTENLGFGTANNEGFRHASGRYLFCLNPDTLLVNNAIGILVDYMEKHPRCGACGGNLYNADMRRAISFRRILPGAFWEFSEGAHRQPEHILYGRNSRFNHTSHPIKVGYITGADLMLRRSVIEEVGAFHPEFFMYYEETDLCCRIHRAGYDVVSVPDAKIIHLEGMSMEKKGVNEKKLKYYAESRVLYYKRNLSLKQAVRAYRFHLKNLREQCRKEGEIRGEAHVHFEKTLAALENYPELKEKLRPIK